MGLIKRLFDFLDLERCYEETFHISTDCPINGTSLSFRTQKKAMKKGEISMIPNEDPC